MERLQLEQGDLFSRAIANLGAYFAATKGQEVDPDEFNGFAKIRYQEWARSQLSPEIAQTFLDLLDVGQLPSWVREEADLKLMRAAANGAERSSD